MKKKILFVTEALWIGGIETALVNLLNRLDYDKYEVTCLLLRSDQTLAERLPPEVRLLVADRDRTVSFREPYAHARLYHLTEEPLNPSRRHRALMWAVPMLKWVENRLFIRYIRENLGRERFDTCVIYSDRTAETAVRAVKAEQFLLFYHHGAMRKAYHDEIGYRKSRKILAVSPGQAEKLRAFRPRYAEKIITVPNVTEEKRLFRMARDPIPEVFSPDRFHIVTCGRISPEKGMDLAVEACARLVEQGHRDIQWWIVGGGPREAELRAKIAALHMGDYVTMVGMKANPYPYIRRADLYVQPSLVESFGLSLCEALLLGRQVVATHTDGARELLEDNRLCAPESGQLAASVARARETMGDGSSAVAKIRQRDCRAMKELEALL